MILQYSAVGIQNNVWACQTRGEYKRNLEYLANSIISSIWIAKMDLPVRLVALSEGAIGGWASGAGGEAHLKVYKELAPEIPGEETDFLGKLCKEYNFYLIGQMQAKDDELMKERIFNIAFIINPEGEIIHKHHKTAYWPLEPMTAPSDIWERYIELYGDDPEKLFEVLYPVARTEIGNIGTLICAEGSFPEAARGLALNGAEIIWRGEYVEPFKGNRMFEIQNRAHAIFNTCYVIQPHTANYYGADGGFSRTGDEKELHWEAVPREHPRSYGTSQIIDYRGNIMSERIDSGESFVSAIINIDGLRDFRLRGLWQNLVKDIRVEEYKVIYDAMMAKGGIYPRNLCMDEPPLTEADQAELCRYNVNRMVELGIYMPTPGWKPYTIGRELIDRVEKARKRR